MTAPADPRLKPPCREADALAVLYRLRESGHQAYFAGGSVRDTLLGLPPKDWDIATDAPPPRVRELFPDTQAVGAAFGVILVRHAKSVVEVATFRSDGPYEDGRRPTSVRFSTAEEDAQRRDFTINGLFFDPIEKKVIDFVGGQEDLKNRLLRAIGDPSKRFSEDHLRLLRAVRFAARFSLQIEPKTAAAIRDASPQLKGISPERIGDELRLMFSPPTRHIAWPLLWQLRLAEILFRFFPAVPGEIDLHKSIFQRLAPGNPIPFSLAIAAATLDVRLQSGPKPALQSLLSREEVSSAIRALRQSLRLSNIESDEATEILESLAPLLDKQPPTLAAKKRFLARSTSASSRLLLEALSSTGIESDRIKTLSAEFATLQYEDNAPAPFLTGDDLTAAGFTPGPAFKRILDAVYDAQLERRIAGKDQALELARTLSQSS
jgi:tRNA nucleotidyltransferase/poly(A) polymerase